MPHKFSEKPRNLSDIFPLDIFEEEVIRKLKNRTNAVYCGASSIYFIILLAKYFKRVYAVEKSSKMVEVLRSELDRFKINNVGLITSENPPEFDFPLDFVLFSNVLHAVEDWRNHLRWASKAKVVCVIEWKKQENEIGPLIDEKEMEKALKESFKFAKKLPISSHHYVLLGYNKEDALDEPKPLRGC